jgi:hypothetical protein
MDYKTASLDEWETNKQLSSFMKKNPRLDTKKEELSYDKIYSLKELYEKYPTGNIHINTFYDEINIYIKTVETDDEYLERLRLLYENKIELEKYNKELKTKKEQREKEEYLRLKNKFEK